MESHEIIRNALAEDLIEGLDLTCRYFVEETTVGRGWIEARQQATLSGVNVTAEVFRQVDPTLELTVLNHDGAKVSSMERILLISGKATSILKAERTALNFLGHLSGIATMTSSFVQKLSGYKTKVLATRKTTPGLRNLEIQAVKDGGGDIYRSNLSNGVLIKDNHIGIWGGFDQFCAKLEEIKQYNKREYEAILQTGKIEVESLDQLGKAVEIGWKHVLLDNFLPSQVFDAVQKFGQNTFLEVSGGVHEKNIMDYAIANVDAISIGALTHSIKSVDFSLEVEWSNS